LPAFSFSFLQTISFIPTLTLRPSQSDAEGYLFSVSASGQTRWVLSPIVSALCFVRFHFERGANRMDYLWTPWRYHYVANAAADKLRDCIFCDAAKRQDDEKTLVVHRAVSSFVILNQYPYTSGHLMIVPYKHTAELSALDAATLTEMMHLAQRCEAAFKSLYTPDGMNFGMNLGRAAGAGIAGHLHLHGLPRWFGDTSFMSVAGETRILPETLDVTFERLRTALA
jgi:ATP adenylyltransferase